MKANELIDYCINNGLLDRLNEERIVKVISQIQSGELTNEAAVEQVIISLLPNKNPQHEELMVISDSSSNSNEARHRTDTSENPDDKVKAFEREEDGELDASGSESDEEQDESTRKNKGKGKATAVSTEELLLFLETALVTPTHFDKLIALIYSGVVHNEKELEEQIERFNQENLRTLQHILTERPLSIEQIEQSVDKTFNGLIRDTSLKIAQDLPRCLQSMTDKINQWNLSELYHAICVVYGYLKYYDYLSKQPEERTGNRFFSSEQEKIFDTLKPIKSKLEEAKGLVYTRYNELLHPEQLVASIASIRL